MSLVDANVVLRYLLDDHEELSSKAAEILERHSVTLPVEVGCEVDFVDTLLWAYQMLERQEVFTFDSKLLNHIQRVAG